MTLIPIFSLLSESPSSVPPPKPRRPVLPPKPVALPAREEAPEPRPAPRQAQPQRAGTATRGAAPGSAKSGVRQAAERDQRDAATDHDQMLLGQGGLIPLPPQTGGGGGSQQGDAQGEGEQDMGGGTGAVLASGELDCDMLAGLLPTEGDDGIFEVLLPDGSRLGVAVDIGEHHVAYLLTPSSEQFRAQINKKKMELQKALMQRMQTDVRLTVL
ncbi:hypothetical protein ACIPEN_02355 [Herbaspirillum chlorophenolicum]|uniref:Uncharacterized protein n=1 Tax=Herbaspirillum chlorophenolicum TaxID=211589 RepID=A0ABW8EUX8_9BURK